MPCRFNALPTAGDGPLSPFRGTKERCKVEFDPPHRKGCEKWGHLRSNNGGILEPGKGEITILLAKWKEGDTSAFEKLMPLVYPHLREVAAAYVRRERNPDVIQGTALVHELYLRLVSQRTAVGEDRSHFYTFAAKVMRMILIDHARGNQTQMRGGGMQRVPLSEDLPWVEIGSAQLLDLNRALDELGELDAHKVQVVELRYFLGCTAEETAELMGVSKATVDRELKFIKSWLYRRVYPDAGEAN